MHMTTQKSVELQGYSLQTGPVIGSCSALALWAYIALPISTPGYAPAVSRLGRETPVLMSHPLGASILVPPVETWSPR